MLSDGLPLDDGGPRRLAGLNAPSGARCFLTRRYFMEAGRLPSGLNAPFGARCFLTMHQDVDGVMTKTS